MEQLRAFVIAGHGDLQKVKAMLAECPELLNAAYEWNENDRETAIQGAAHVGNVAIAEYLLAQGAPLEICTAAMLGHTDDVARFLRQDPTNIHTVGAHGIPLLTHAALSGNLELIQMLTQHGAQAGLSAALHNAVSKGHAEIVRWLLENGSPDLAWQNFQGKTALAIAVERNDQTIAQLLRDHGATV
jgi:ankyrin repeat protein